MKQLRNVVAIVVGLSIAPIPALTPPEHEVQNRLRVGLLSVTFSPDGGMVATAGWLAGHGVGLRLWDVKRNMFQVLVAPSVTAASFSPDGKWIAYVDGGVVADYQLSSGKSRLLGLKSSRALTVAYSADGAWIATGHQDGSVHAWSTKTGESKLLGSAARGDTDTVVWAPRDSLIASGGDDQAVRLWNARTGAARLLGAHGGNEVFGLAFSPDGKLLATAASNDADSPWLWNVETGTRTRFGGDRTTVPYCAAFNPDGGSFALGKQNGAVTVYQVKDQSSRDLVQTGLPVYAVAYSPDGKLLATGGADGILHLWDAKSGSAIAAR